ncbi:MAG: hypothetical protein ACYC7L_04115 [Nitrospirota bacterium]
MTRMVRCAFPVMLVLAFSLQPLLSLGGVSPGKTAAEKEPLYPSMSSPGSKVPIGSDHYLIFGFDKKPKLGTIILKVEIFTRDGNKDTSYEVLADSGMPSMKGAHETGEQPLQISKKGAYLLPVNIVMPGDWEVRITIKKGGKVVFRGSHQFDV